MGMTFLTAQNTNLSIQTPKARLVYAQKFLQTIIAERVPLEYASPTKPPETTNTHT